MKRKLNSIDVIDVLTDQFILRGVPSYIRSDNGAEFIAEAVRKWINAVGAKTAYIEPGSPWENGYVESSNARFRDELLGHYGARQWQLFYMWVLQARHLAKSNNIKGLNEICAG